MQPQMMVLAFVLTGAASCALAILNFERESLLLSASGSVILATLGAGVGNSTGSRACAIIAAGTLGCALFSGRRRGTSPLAPFAVIASMGLYLRGSSAAGATEKLLLLLGAALALNWIVRRKLAGDDAQIGSATMALGILALGLASEAGHTGPLRWWLDSSLLACPLLAAAIAGFFSARGDERRDVVTALCVAGALLARSASTAELCALLAVAGALHVMNSRRRGRALLDVFVGAAVVALLGINFMDRQFVTWLRAPKDVYGSGFDLHTFFGVLGDAQPLGVGVVSPAATLTADSSSAYVLGQATSAFGWAGIVLPLVCAASVAIVCLRALPALAPAERNLALALLATFGVFAVGNVTYAFHLLPVPAMPFPLLSPGTSPMLAFALLGTTLSRLVGGARAPQTSRGTLAV